MFSNTDLSSIITPINVTNLGKLLRMMDYDPRESSFLLQGFTEGFSIGHEGPTNRNDTSRNLPLRVGSKVQLWNKVMDEVQLGRYAGPFEKPPFTNFIQSPIGLVPKANNKVCLIFHLSYDFESKHDDEDNLDKHRSLNYHTPQEKCSVKYNDLDHAVQVSLQLIEEEKCKSSSLSSGKQDDEPVILFYGKTDASRLLDRCLLSLAILGGC